MNTADAACPVGGRCMVVLIDYSGSMTLDRLRDDGTSAGTRFEAAQSLAIDQVDFYGDQGTLAGVAVYTFRNSGITAVTSDGAGSAFVGADQAVMDIAAIPAPIVGPVTPLGDSICDAVDQLVAVGDVTNTRILHISTDGGENASDPAKCGGPPSVDPNEPFTAGSWHRKAYEKVYPLSGAYDITVIMNLFQASTIVNPIAALAAKASAPPLEVSAIALAAKAIAADEPITDVLFFSKLVARGGGSIHVVEDRDELPVVGDVGGDRCVDIADAIDVVRHFGRPADTRYDLNLDGRIGFLDFLAVLATIDGTCGVRDTTVPVNPLRCSAGRVVIENKSITTPATGIDIRGVCDITIKNSRIVTGRDAIRIHGSARITIDNSTVAGERSFLVLDGGAWIRARNSLFRGGRVITGGLLIEDLGGNDWE